MLDLGADGIPNRGIALPRLEAFPLFPSGGLIKLSSTR
jgi:hypothetical protein